MGRPGEIATLVRQKRSIAQIAEELGIQSSTVTSYLNRAIGDGLLTRSDVLFSIGEDDRTAIEQVGESNLNAGWMTVCKVLEKHGKHINPDEVALYLKYRAFRRFRFHDLRHTAASLRLAQGDHPKVVQELLGHARISITFDLYSHVMPSLQSESAEKRDRTLAKMVRGS